MACRKLAAGLLAVWLAAPGIQAQTATSGAAAGNAVDPASIQALKDMGAHLQSLKRFRVSTELTGERVLADGQKLQHVATAEMDVERPNKLRVLMRSARSERELERVWRCSGRLDARETIVDHTGHRRQLQIRIRVCSCRR